MKKSGIFLVLSPVFIGLLRLIASLVFRLLQTAGAGDAGLLLVIKSFVNRILGMLALISLPLCIVGIVMMSKNKNGKLGGVIRDSRQMSKKHMTRYLLGFGLLILIQILDSTLNGTSENPGILIRLVSSYGERLVTIVGGLMSLLATLIGRWITLGLIKISLGIVYEEEYTPRQLFMGWQSTIRYIIANIFVGVIVCVGFILLIVPGIIRGFRLSIVPYLIVREGLCPMKAIKKSRKITKGFVGELFGINILVALINILGVIALFVGLLWTIPLCFIANAIIYKKITEIANTQK